MGKETMTDTVSSPSLNPYDYLSEDELLSVLNASTPDDIPLDLTAKVLNLQESIGTQSDLSSQISKIEDSRLFKDYESAMDSSPIKATLEDLKYRGREALSVGARAVGSAAGGLAGLTPVGRPFAMTAAALGAPELGDIAAAGVDVLTGKSEKDFSDTLSDYRKENLLSTTLKGEMPTLEGAVEAGLSSLSGITPKPASNLVKAYGSEKRATSLLKQTAKNLKSGDTSEVAGYLGGNIEGLSKTLRDGVTKVGQRAVELLNSPSLRNTKTVGETIEKVVKLRSKIAAERLKDVARVASKTGARVAPIVDDVTISIANKTGAAIPSQMRITRETLDSALDQLQSLMESLKQFKVGDESLTAIEKLKNSIPVDEAMEAGVTIRGLRNSIRSFERVNMGDSVLTGRANQLAAILDEIATSVDDAVKASLNNAISSSTGVFRGIKYNAAKYDEATDNIRVLFQMEDALQGGLKTQASETKRLTTKVAKGVVGPSIIDQAMAPVSGAVRSGTRGILQSLFPGATRSPADEAISYTANKDIGLDVLRGIAGVNKLEGGTLTSASRAAGASLVNPVEEAMQLGGVTDILAPQADILSSEPIADPLVDGVDTNQFYLQQTNIPDQVEEGVQDEQQTEKIARNTTAVMQYMVGKDLAMLGIPEQEAQEISALMSATEEDQKRGVMLLARAKPELFEPSPIPGFTSLINGAIVDPEEKVRAEALLDKRLSSDPIKKAKAIKAIRADEPLPTFSYKFLGGESKKELEDEFLSQQEGFRTKAYLDTARDGERITIGEGVNLSDTSISQLRDLGIKEDVIAKIAPYIGKRGSSAKDVLKNNPLELSEEEALNLSKAFKQETVDKINNAYKAETGVEIKDIPAPARAVLLSLGYNLGANLKSAAPKIWRAALSGRWDVIADRLENPRNWSKNPELMPRRLREAKLLRDMIGSEKIEMAALNNDIAIKGEESLADGTKRLVYRF